MAKNTDKITIKIEGKEWQDALDKAFDKKKKEVKVDGFREGAVPRNIYIEKFGIESLYMDAVDNVMDKAYQEALKKSKIVPVVEPKINISQIDDKTVTFDIELTGKPDVTLGEYKNLKVKKEQPSVTKEEIDTEIEHLRDQFAEIKVKEDGKIENGDTAVIDFKGTVDGKPLEGGTGANYPLEIGSHTFIPGFEEALVGMKVNDEKDIKLTFPKDYVKDLAGKEVEFHVTIHEIKTRVLPDIDENFFKDLGYEKVTNKEELVKEVEKVVKDRKQGEIDDRFIEEVLSKASENMKVELSDDIIHDEIHRMLDQFANQLKMQGLTVDQYLQFSKMSHEDLENQMKPEATKRIKYRYLLESVADAEKITVSDKEADKSAEEMAKNYGISKEELVKAYGSTEVLKYDARMRKTLEFLRDNN